VCERPLLCRPFRPFSVRVVRRPWLDEPRQSLCQPVGLKKPKPRLDERWLPPAYPDNLVVSKTLRGWYVLALDCVSLSGLGSRSLGSMSDGCHLPIPTAWS
ncbi:MAG: hypothetical protein ACK5AC_09395, partial [Planctomycetota bacterium]